MLIQKRFAFLWPSLLILLMLFVSLTSSCTTESTSVYRLSTSSAPGEGGTVSPAGGEFEEGEQVQVTANPNPNWLFDGWEGDMAGSQNPVSLTMDDDKQVTARFIKKLFPLTVNVEGQGSVTESLVQTKTTDYEAGSVIELNAVPQEKWEFAAWEGDLEGDENPARISLDAPKSVTARFVETFTVTATAEGPGEVSVTPDKPAYRSGEFVTFEAVADPDNEFLGWFGDFEDFSEVVEVEITDDTEVTAFFSSVENAIQIETGEISVEDGAVSEVVFNITNFLLNDLEITQFTVDDESGSRVGESNLSSPFEIDPRTILQLRIQFQFETTDPNTFEMWTFNWTFEYQGEQFTVSQVVGEPEPPSKVPGFPSVRNIVSLESKHGRNP